VLAESAQVLVGMRDRSQAPIWAANLVPSACSLIA
jgi:hypothetical protein